MLQKGDKVVATEHENVEDMRGKVFEVDYTYDTGSQNLVMLKGRHAFVSECYLQKRDDVQGKLKENDPYHKYYDCMSCGHSMSTDDNKLMCVFYKKHFQADEEAVCGNWN